jgi:hypothetical protein
MAPGDASASARDAGDSRHPFRLRDDQWLALDVCLRRGPAAVESWERWKRVAGTADLEPGTFRLGPLMYRNLEAHGVRDPDLGRLRGLYRATWCANQLLFRAMLPHVERMQSAGIPVILLKGAALAVLHYGDIGARPMADLDVLVPRDQIEAATRILLASGFARAPGAPDRFNATLSRLFHAYTFEDRYGRHLDLHWRLFAAPGGDEDEPDVWNATVPMTVQGLETLALGPADQLLHVCGHGAAWNHVPPLRWMTDAAAVMRTSGASIDWGRLRAGARGCRMVLALRTALRTLERSFDIAAPDGFLASLDEIPVSKAERLQFEASIDPLGLASWVVRTRMAVRTVARSPRGQRLKAASEVLRFVARTDRVRDTPWRLARKLAWRVSRTAARLAHRQP